MGHYRRIRLRCRVADGCLGAEPAGISIANRNQSLLDPMILTNNWIVRRAGSALPIVKQHDSDQRETYRPYPSWNPPRPGREPQLEPAGPPCSDSKDCY